MQQIHQRNFRARFKCLGFCCGIVLLWSSSVFAYIPPSQYILRTWLNKHNGIRSIKVKTTVTAPENDKPTGVHFKENTLYIADKMTLRSWATDDQDKKLYAVQRDLTSTSPVAKIFFSTDWQDVIRTLKTKKIPFRTEADL